MTVATSVAVGSVRLLIPSSRSLKDKRQVVRSATARMRQRFNVSVAEVGDLDNWQAATIGIAAISNDASYAQGAVTKAVEWLGEERLDVEIADVSVEVW